MFRRGGEEQFVELWHVLHVENGFHTEERHNLRVDVVSGVKHQLGDTGKEMSDDWKKIGKLISREGNLLLEILGHDASKLCLKSRIRYRIMAFSVKISVFSSCK